MHYIYLSTAAEKLGVSVGTLRRRIKAGQIPGAKRDPVSGYWLIPLAWVKTQDRIVRGDRHD